MNLWINTIMVIWHPLWLPLRVFVCPPAALGRTNILDPFAGHWAIFPLNLCQCVWRSVGVFVWAWFSYLMQNWHAYSHVDCQAVTCLSSASTAKDCSTCRTFQLCGLLLLLLLRPFVNSFKTCFGNRQVALASCCGFCITQSQCSGVAALPCGMCSTHMYISMAKPMYAAINQSTT